MKVWLLYDLDNGEADVYSEDTNPLEIPYVMRELGYLEGAYDDEREQFIADVEHAITWSRGEATIEERLRLELVNVKHLTSKEN